MTKQVRALVVEDSAPMRRSIVYALTRHGGIACEEAENGVQALERFGASAFDLVVTDINMPLLNGLKLIEAIRAGSHRPQTPILVISTETSEQDRARALAAGANAYLTKPIQAPQLLGAVQSLLNLAGAP